MTPKEARQKAIDIMKASLVTGDDGGKELCASTCEDNIADALFEAAKPYTNSDKEDTSFVEGRKSVFRSLLADCLRELAKPPEPGQSK